jgi:hypothetical protein
MKILILSLSDGNLHTRGYAGSALPSSAALRHLPPGAAPGIGGTTATSTTCRMPSSLRCLRCCCPHQVDGCRCWSMGGAPGKPFNFRSSLLTTPHFWATDRADTKTTRHRQICRAPSMTSANNGCGACQAPSIQGPAAGRLGLAPVDRMVGNGKWAAIADFREQHEASQAGGFAKLARTRSYSGVLGGGACCNQFLQHRPARA